MLFLQETAAGIWKLLTRRSGPEGKVKNEKSAVPTCRCSFDSSRCTEHANITQVGSIRTPRPSNISGTTCGFQGKLLSNLGENASQSPFSSHFLSSCVHVPHIRGRFPDSEHCPSCHLPVQAAICPHTATLSSQPAADSCKTCSFSRFPVNSLAKQTAEEMSPKSIS
mgnify:CR=1 FL=1